MYIIKLSVDGTLDDELLLSTHLSITDCTHPTWLRLLDVKDVTLIDTGRLTRLISKLDRPSI